ncbi:hypothetical protein [Pontibacter arcticus]|uniref:O-antigen ligase n=1 Tax=Pontibacter arcticus TaxID=2080288 RepID=A0A364RFC6_9BACT|nr:hypothetical protein [Pontibacter arcticus]RAU82993.1 hypothetical protein DP923_07070 [Pontibacter arcticus]
MSKIHNTNYILFCALLLLFMASALVLNNTGFAVVGAILGLWTLISGIYTYKTEKIVNVPDQLYFFIFFTLYILIAINYWEVSYDYKDIIATYLFFIIIPLLLVSLDYTYPSFCVAAHHALNAFFVIFSVLMFGHALLYGVDWERSYLFNNGMLHKNGISSIYEIVYIYVLYSKAKTSKNLLFYSIILTGGICLIFIGSKTSIVLAFIFTLALFSKILFFFLLILILVVLTYLVFFLNDINTSPFRTASFRGMLWEQAWEEITFSKTSLLLGNGPGTFISKIKEYGLFKIEGTHNFILQILHNFGIVGLGLFSKYFYRIARQFKIFSSPAAAAFWMFNMHALFDVGWVKGAGFFASLFFGLAIAEAKKQVRHEELS